MIIIGARHDIGQPKMRLLWMSAVVTTVHIKSNMEPNEVSFKEKWGSTAANERTLERFHLE